jgi:hypothetical protein
MQLHRAYNFQRQHPDAIRILDRPD